MTGAQTIGERLRGAPDAATRRVFLQEALPSAPTAVWEVLADIEEGPARWSERAVVALASARVGDSIRAARTLTAALRSQPQVFEAPGTVEAAVELAGASDWAARLLSNVPELVLQLCHSAAAAAGGPPDAASEPFLSAVHRLCEAAKADPSLFEAGLRQLRVKESLRIALRELRGADIRSTSAELADLASAALQGALDHHLERMTTEHGPLVPPCRQLVVGLGKLGGRELNFSSDIDLLYLYEHDDGGAGSLSNHQFHVRLFERLTQSLSRSTELGRVFRVDIDLRPEGRTGPLCNSLAGLERYYETWGRDWERAAWIKARPVAGDLDLFDEVGRFARPFVYRRTRDLSVVEGVIDMKAQIDAQRRRKGLKARSGFDLKLGRGGIREIEFFAQGQQLLFGGRDPSLRKQGTLPALQALEVAGRVKARDREVLANAYLFFRRVEHRVQLVEDRQTHILPGGDSALPIARTLGFESADDLRSELERHAESVNRLFTGLLGAVNDEPPPPSGVELLLDRTAPEASRRSVAEQLGFTEAQSTLAHLAAAARWPMSPFHPAASQRSARLARQLVAECLASPDLNRAVRHLPDFLRALANHGAYWEQLERPEIRRGVARLLGASDLLARILTSSPGLLPDVLYAGKLPSVDALQRTVEGALDPARIEASLGRLRYLKMQETLRVATGELAGAVATVDAQAQLTLLAECIIDVTLKLATAEAEQRYGLPEDRDAALVILAGGTLGAGELGYRSDLDLSAIYTGTGDTVGGARGSVSVSEFYTRVVQRMLSFLTLRLPEGILYPTDMRLRPSGSQGALVTTLQNFETYHQAGRAKLWERQALVRTRVVAGTPRLAFEVERALRQATYGPEYSVDRARAVHEMREKMAKERPGRRKKAGGDPFDIKMGSGGLVELEFVVQHLLLLHGRDDQSLPSTNTRTALERLAARGHLKERTVLRLQLAHLRLRRVLDWVRVIHDEMLDIVDLVPSGLRPLALALGYQGREAQELLRRDLDVSRRAVRRVYRAVIGRDLGEG